MNYKNQDCLEYLKTLNDKSVNLCLTDPPYLISRNTNFQSGEMTGRDVDRFRISMDFGDWDKQPLDMQLVFDEIYRVLKDGGTFICFYDLWKIESLREYMENSGFKQIRFIEWIKTNPVPINSKINYLTNSREVAVIGIKKSKPTFNSEYDNGIYFYPICQDKGRFHPTQKPLALMEELIKKHSNNGDIVLDCFAGSATTGVAALNLGREFYGCEINKDYYTNSLLRFTPEQLNSN